MMVNPIEPNSDEQIIQISKAEAKKIIKEFASDPLPKIFIEDGTVLLTKEKGVLFKVSIDQFVKTIDHYQLKNLLNNELYKHLKSVRDEVNSKKISLTSSPKASPKSLKKIHASHKSKSQADESSVSKNSENVTTPMNLASEKNVTKEGSPSEEEALLVKSGLENTEDSILLENQKKFKQELDALFLKFSSKKESESSSIFHDSEFRAKLFIDIYSKFHGKLDFASLNKILKESSLNLEEILDTSKQLGLDFILEGDVHPFINQSEHLLRFDLYSPKKQLSDEEYKYLKSAIDQFNAKKKSRTQSSQAPTHRENETTPKTQNEEKRQKSRPEDFVKTNTPHSEAHRTNRRERIEKEIEPEKEKSSSAKTEGTISLASKQRFKQEMERLSSILTCKNPTELASVLTVDEFRAGHILTAYSSFQDHLDTVSLKKIMEKNTLDSEEILHIARQLGLDFFLEKDVHQFVNKPDKFLLTIEIFCLSQRYFNPSAMHTVNRGLLSLSEEELKPLLQLFFNTSHPGNSNTFRKALIKKYVELLTAFPLAEISQFSIRHYDKIPSNKNDYNFSGRYSLREGVSLKEVIEKQKYYHWPEIFFLAATAADEADFVEKTLTNSSPPGDDVALHYVINRSNWAEENYNIDQIKYGSKMHEGVLVGLKALEENRWNFIQHLRFLEYHRMGMAVDLQKTYSYYGMLNCSDDFRMHSPCSEKTQYQILGRQLPGLIEKWKQEENSPLKEGKGNLVPFPSGTKEDYCYIEFNCKGKKLQLSTFVLAEDGSVTTIIHPLFDVTPPIFEYLSEVYNDSLIEKNQEVLLQNLGKIFWLICQAKPWTRGDPSIAEMLIKTVWKHNTGKDMPPWAVDLIPWERVIEYSNPDDFTNDFALMFSKSPLAA